MKKIIQLAVMFVLVATVSASDRAVLRNGFAIKHELREVSGDNTRLYLDADKSSFIEVRTADIEKFEATQPEPVIDAGVIPAAPQSVKAKALSQIVADVSGKHNLDADLINSIIRAESSGNTNAKSRKGALGLMQLMPKTAVELGVQDSLDPEQNIEGGTRYLRSLLEKYDYDLVKALAAYNAGPQRVDEYKGVPPYRETRVYVAKIVRDFNSRKRAQAKRN